MNVDVVVVSHESSAHLARSLQDLGTVATVFVVDNASTDGSVEIAQALGASVTANDVNAGFAAAANQGASLGSNDVILFLNPDASIGQTDLQLLLDVLDQQPELAIVSPRIRSLDGQDQRTSWPFPSASGAWHEAFGLHRIRPLKSGEGFIIGACFMVRRRVFERLGGFDTRFWLYAEETDLCRRALDIGWRVAVVEAAEAIHLGGASGRGEPDLVLEHFERGGDRFVLDCEGRRGLLSFRLANLTGAAIRSVAAHPAERRAFHRGRFRRIAARLATHPLRVASNSPATQSPAHALVVCSLEPWDDVWRRNQFIVRELLDLDPQLRVLFVEPPFDWAHQLRSPNRLARRRGVRSVRPDGRLFALQPVKLFPRLLGPLADRSLRRQVRRAASDLGFTEPALWVNDALYAALLSDTGWPSLYDITDDWLQASLPTRVVRRIATSERSLLMHADAVVVCSPGLASTRHGQRPDLVTIPNGVDADHFTAPAPRPSDLPSSPVAVYVGSLHEDRLDLSILFRLAAGLPDLAIVLVGPNALRPETSHRLGEIPNVHLLGPRPYAEVPAYLQHADVIIVPHVVTPFTESLDPIKAYECLAVGRPTVATPVAGFREIGAPIHIAAAEDFVEQVEAALECGPPTDPRQTPTWGERAVAFADVLQGARRHAKRSRPSLRVVFVDHCAQLSGGELALVRLLPALIDVDAHVILGEHGPLEARLAASNISFEVIELDEAVRATRRSDVRIGRLGPAQIAGAARDVATLRRRLRELQPDLVHTNSLKAAVYGGLAARLASVPVVWHIRDRIAPDYLPASAVIALRWLAFVVPGAVIFNSRSTRETLGNVQRVNVIPSPVIHDSVAFSRTRAEGAPDAPRIIMVGRLAPWKGQHVFLEAFAKAFPSGDAQAIIAGTAMFGEDTYAEELRALTDRLGVSDRVEFAGFVDDIPALLSEVDVVVHASVIPEPFGQVVIEGMAAGLPVIGSDAGGPREVITHEVNGLLVPLGNSDALSAQISRLASDSSLRARLGTAARERARDFAPERVAAQVRAVWTTVVERGA